MAQWLDVSHNVSRVQTTNGPTDGAVQLLEVWPQRICARRLGQAPAGMKIFAVGSGWGSARRGRWLLWGSGLALTLTQ